MQHTEHEHEIPFCNYLLGAYTVANLSLNLNDLYQKINMYLYSSSADNNKGKTVKKN